MKFRFWFLILFVTGFAALAVVSYFVFKSATSDYVEMTYANADEGRVEACTDYKGEAYLSLANKKKYVLPNSRNYNYSPFSLSKFLQVGDVITKEKNSLSLTIHRGDRQCIFVLGKDIKKE